MISLMTPLEAAWDTFLIGIAIQFNYSFIYKPNKFLLNGTICIPHYRFYSFQTKQSAWIIIYPTWPIPEQVCRNAISLCKETQLPVFIFVGLPHEQKGVFYSPLLKEDVSDLPSEPDDHGHWRTPTKYVYCSEYFPNDWAIYDIQQGIAGTYALPYQCPKCQIFRFQSFSSCHYCPLGSTVSIDSPFFYHETPFLREEYAFAWAIADAISQREWPDYFSYTFGSICEQVFWEAFISLPQNIGFHPIWLFPQLPIGKFFTDFAFPPGKIVVEVDGLKGHSTPDDIAKDRRRQRYLESEDWKVIRFGGKEVFSNARACAEETWNIITKKMISQEVTLLPKCQNPSCGKPLLQVGGRGHRKKEYCSDRCRQTSYRARLSEELRIIKEDIKTIKGVILN